jgi:hypothetical protein
VSQVDFLVFNLNPDNLINQLISPTIHQFDGCFQLCVENPQEDESAVWQSVNAYLSNIFVAHCVVLQVKLAVWKHELAVILLGTLYSPGRVNQHYIKGSHDVYEKVPIEVLHVTANESWWI